MKEQLDSNFDDQIKEKVVICKKCGCEKTISELKELHKTCFEDKNVQNSNEDI